MIANEMAGGPMIEVTENQPEQRFEATIDGETAGRLDYVFDGDVLVTTHTVVSPDYEGRGVGSHLAAAVLKRAT
jgi:predicted GNAT family acetyltransferase